MDTIELIVSFRNWTLSSKSFYKLEYCEILKKIEKYQDLPYFSVQGQTVFLFILPFLMSYFLSFHRLSLSARGGFLKRSDGRCKCDFHVAGLSSNAARQTSRFGISDRGGLAGCRDWLDIPGSIDTDQRIRGRAGRWRSDGCVRGHNARQ